jgi:GNAT superfamily N-acetyltransferase
MTSKSVRRATIDDVAMLTEIRNDAHAKKLANSDYAWGKEGDGFSERWIRDHLSRHEVYLVEVDGAAAGTFSFAMEDDQRWGGYEPGAGYVHGLCVRKGFNGQGIGSFMLDWCGAWAISLGLRFVRLDCPAHIATLCAYYESVGFIRAGLWQEPGAGGYVWSLYEKALHSRLPG